MNDFKAPLFLGAVRPLTAYFILNNRIYQSPDLYGVISNRLVCLPLVHHRRSNSTKLTTLHSLQASLEIVRSHRPDFTPRKGFIWPIVEDTSAANSSDILSDPSSRSERHSLASGEGQQIQTGGATGVTIASTAKSRRLTQAVPTNSETSKSKTVINTQPLLLAMSTTAAHSKAQFTLSVLPELLESSSVVGTTAEPVPAPSSSVQNALPVASAVTDVPLPQRGPPGGGKKKRKRLSCDVAS